MKYLFGFVIFFLVSSGFAANKCNTILSALPRTSSERFLKKTFFDRNSESSYASLTPHDQKLLSEFKNNRVFYNWIQKQNFDSKVKSLSILKRFSNEKQPSKSKTQKGRTVDLGRFENSTELYTEYEREVLNLRAGDKVKFGARTIKLGRFLGAGNATHIFQLQDDPQKVIRIPFAVSFVKEQYSPFELLEYYKDSEPVGFKNYARILEKNKRGYIISEFIDGVVGYDEIVQQLKNSKAVQKLVKKLALDMVEQIIPIEIENIKERSQLVTKDLPLEEKELIYKLAMVIYKASENYRSVLEGGSYDRQLVWSTVRKDWYFLDWSG